MAKAKKAMMPKVVILPEEQQPFKVPENWIWTDIESINNYKGSSIDPMKNPDSEYELYSVPSSAENYPEIVSGSEIGSTKQSVEKGDVLLCKINPRINRVWKVSQHTENELLASSEWIIIRNAAINPDYLMYCFRTQYFLEFMLSNVSGVGGSLMRAQPKFVKNYPVPIAPIQEQQRIVDRIESIFVKLDEAKEKAQSVVDGFELRKSAILHKAFIGELTAQWRQEHGVGLDSWEKRTLNSVCKSIYDGDHMPPPKSEDGVPFLVISNVNTGHLSYENTRFVPQDYYDALSDTRKPELGDVLYTLVGSYGIPVVVDDEKPFCFQRHMALLKPESIDTYFLWYLLQTHEMYNKATEIATGTAQLTVPIKGLRALEFMCPDAYEQKQIVTMVSDILNKEQKAKEAAEAVIDQIDTMKKSVLARAFRGELGTNDLAEESAMELLKSVL